MSTAAQDRALFRHDLRPPARYTAAAQALHWLTALLMFAILPVAWHMTMLARDNPARETWYTVHKSLGLTILATLYLGWHYFVDTLAGVVVGALAFVIAAMATGNPLRRRAEPWTFRRAVEEPVPETEAESEAEADRSLDPLA